MEEGKKWDVLVNGTEGRENEGEKPEGLEKRSRGEGKEEEGREGKNEEVGSKEKLQEATKEEAGMVKDGEYTGEAHLTTEAITSTRLSKMEAGAGKPQQRISTPSPPSPKQLGKEENVTRERVAEQEEDGSKAVLLVPIHGSAGAVAGGSVAVPVPVVVMPSMEILLETGTVCAPSTSSRAA